MEGAFEDLFFNIDNQGQEYVWLCGVWIGNYLGGEAIRRTEVKVRVGKLKTGKAAGKDVVKGEMTKGGGDKVLD